MKRALLAVMTATLVAIALASSGSGSDPKLSSKEGPRANTVVFPITGKNIPA